MICSANRATNKGFNPRLHSFIVWNVMVRSTSYVYLADTVSLIIGKQQNFFCRTKVLYKIGYWQSIFEKANSIIAKYIAKNTFIHDFRDEQNVFLALEFKVRILSLRWNHLVSSDFAWLDPRKKELKKDAKIFKSLTMGQRLLMRATNVVWAMNSSALPFIWSRCSTVPSGTGNGALHEIHTTQNFMTSLARSLPYLYVLITLIMITNYQR